jgi:hypothetical protein
MLGAERVQFLGRVSAAQLSACYATASVYLSMSRHEGFGVPLLEAMYRGVPVVAYGAAAVPDTMAGAGVATRTNEPLEVARLLAALEHNPALKQEMLAAQRARVAQLGQEAVATAIREALQPFLAGPSSPPGSSAGDLAGVTLVCPGLAAFPEAPASRLALQLAERLSPHRLLTLDPSPRPTQRAPRTQRVGGQEVLAFSPDEPLSREPSWPLPGSSSLELALRTSRSPLLFLPADARLARDTLPFVSSRAWGVRDVKEAAPAPEVTSHLGSRLLSVDFHQPEPAVSALIQALRPLGASRAS